ncbi:MAG: hypothetical protein AB1582_10455 [Pseudomonadota bacterium]
MARYGQNTGRCDSQDVADHQLRRCALSPRCGCVAPAKLVQAQGSDFAVHFACFIRAACRHRQRAKVFVTVLPCGLVSLLDSLRFRTSGPQEFVIVMPMAEIGRPFA